MATSLLLLSYAVRLVNPIIQLKTHLANLPQDPEAGGFADRPGNAVDVFHTVFAVAGLSLLGFEGIAEVDPV